MNTNRFHGLILLFFILVWWTAACAEETEIKALRVVSIKIDGIPVETVSEVPIIAQGQSVAVNYALKIDDEIEQGAEIVVPSRTVLILESVNGSQVRLQPGSRFKVNLVTSEGENYGLLFGKALFQVGRALNFFNVNYQSFLAIVRGTEFDMMVEPGNKISFELIRGKLVVRREVMVKILGQVELKQGQVLPKKEKVKPLAADKLTEGQVEVKPKSEVKTGDTIAMVAASDIMEQGARMQVSYRPAAEESQLVFHTPDEAEIYFQKKLVEGVQSGEYEHEQNGRANLGIILATVGKPREAITYFEPALKAARERGDQMREAGILNNLGVVYHSIREYGSAIELHKEALALELKLYPDGEHPQIVRSYNNLGIAYFSLGNSGMANTYFDKSRALEVKVLHRRDAVERIK